MLTTGYLLVLVWGLFVMARVGKLTEKLIAYYLVIFLETYPPSFS